MNTIAILEHLTAEAYKIYDAIVDRVSYVTKQAGKNEGGHLCVLLHQNASLGELYIGLLHSFTCEVYENLDKIFPDAADMKKEYFDGFKQDEYALTKFCSYTIIEGFIMDGKSKFMKNMGVFDSELDMCLRNKTFVQEWDLGMPEKFYFPFILTGWYLAYYYTVNDTVYLDRGWGSINFFSQVPSKYDNNDYPFTKHIDCEIFMKEFFSAISRDSLVYFRVNMLGKKIGDFDFYAYRALEKKIYKNSEGYNKYYVKFAMEMEKCYQ